jgi:hypothetical protein
MRYSNCTLAVLRKAASAGCISCNLFVEAIVVYASSNYINVPDSSKVAANHVYIDLPLRSSDEGSSELGSRITPEIFCGIQLGEGMYCISCNRRFD